MSFDASLGGKSAAEAGGEIRPPVVTEVDECPGCGGFWLDAGELSKIRDLFETEEERHKAAEEYFSEVFGGELASMEAEDQVKLNKVLKISNMFRFICPSYYIPGKQDWGAF